MESINNLQLHDFSVIYGPAGLYAKSSSTFGKYFFGGIFLER